MGAPFMAPVVGMVNVGGIDRTEHGRDPGCGSMSVMWCMATGAINQAPTTGCDKIGNNIYYFSGGVVCHYEKPLNAIMVCSRTS